ncbi:Hypothetical predicted protein [Mytilus galloprovincialis]|uniref:Uncharacterized protein n=1 Tax=Mytilus galloprovincialis TaxID=29158 RepID=A0A8B6GV96_MYTGA|nr:Hypothetical predicted protein [Mytilus galloprovincialis]
MAEKKYDLALVKTVTDKKIRPQEWYKERLQTKFIKSLKPTDTSKHLVGKNWLFVKDGLDDFRDGYPPPVEGDIILKGSKGPGPNIKGSGENLSSVKQPAAKKRFTKHQICYSRQTPLQQQMRDHIDEVEFGLTQHPLALYPHFEENCPPDLFDMIVDLLDPEINMMSEEGSERDEYDEEIVEENEEERKSDIDEEDDKSVKEEKEKEKEMENFGGEKIPRHPYRWKDKKDKKKPGDVKSTQAETQEDIPGERVQDERRGNETPSPEFEQPSRMYLVEERLIPNCTGLKNKALMVAFDYLYLTEQDIEVESLVIDGIVLYIDMDEGYDIPVEVPAMDESLLLRQSVYPVDYMDGFKQLE